VSTLASGIRLVTETMPGALSVSTGVWVGVGARDESPELSGVSHFLEHLLFKGTETRRARDIAESIDRVGGDMNAFTSKELTAYYTRLPARDWRLGVEILGDVLSAPALRPSDVETEREVILEELGMDEDAHDDRVMTLLAESLFPDHPLGRETAGDKETVASLTPEAVRTFFETWYRAGNMVVSMAGALSHEEARAAVEAAFVGAAGGDRPVRSAPMADVRAVSLIRRKSEQAHLAVGYRAFKRDDPDREALDVATQVLGGGPSSRLFEEIREQRGLAYSVYSGVAAYADAGALSVYAGTSPSHVDEVMGLIDGELRKLAADGITEHELDVAKGYLTGSFVLGLEDSASRMSRLAHHVTMRGAVRPVADQLARYDAVTLEDVTRAVRRVLENQRVVAAVGPVKKAQLTV
jgi:predicted Zn-dependent peptidase